MCAMHTACAENDGRLRDASMLCDRGNVARRLVAHTCSERRLVSASLTPRHTGSDSCPFSYCRFPCATSSFAALAAAPEGTPATGTAGETIVHTRREQRSATQSQTNAHLRDERIRVDRNRLARVFNRRSRAFPQGHRRLLRVERLLHLAGRRGCSCYERQRSYSAS